MPGDILLSLVDSESENVQNLDYGEVLDVLVALRILQADLQGETLILTTPTGYAEVLFPTAEQARMMELDLRLRAWDGLLTEPKHNSDDCDVVRFFPGNRFTCGKVAGKVDALIYNADPTPSFMITVDGPYGDILWNSLSVDLEKVLVGKTLRRVYGKQNGWRRDVDQPLKIGLSDVRLETDEGTVVLWHDQMCCENATLFDFEGDEDDLVGATVRRVSVSRDRDQNTFYSIRTTNGDLWLRFGNGNSTMYSIAMKVGFIGDQWSFDTRRK
jgi:hypothetical protein